MAKAKIPKEKLTKAVVIRLLVENPAVSPVVAGAAYGLAKNAAYRAVKSGEIASKRIGRKIVCPSAPILKDLGLDAAIELMASPVEAA